MSRTWTRAGVRHGDERWYWVCNPGGYGAMHPVRMSRAEDGSTYIHDRAWLGCDWPSESEWLRSVEPIKPPEEPPHAH